MTYTSWGELQDVYNETLDAQGEVSIGSLTFAPSEILKQMNPLAYRVGLHDFAEAKGIDTDAFDDWFMS